MRKEVCLYELEQLGLILLEPTGVYYHNQVGSYSCIQKYEQGVFVFVDDNVRTAYKYISTLLRCKEDLSMEDADKIDAFLSKDEYFSYLSVDRNRIKESKEAWVYVNINYDSPYLSFKGFTSNQGVLTWDNSD